MKTSFVKIVTSLSLFGLLASCGGSGGGAGPKKFAEQLTPGGPATTTPEPERLPVDGSNIQGTYKAVFETMNTKITFNNPGSATFQRKDDKLLVYFRLFGGKAFASHRQSVHLGTRCPGPQDDLNGDGYIDINEGNKVWGKIIVPVDSDVSTQIAGRTIHAASPDLSGSYWNEQEVDFQTFFDDLKDEDLYPNDNIQKLAADEPFTFENKVVVVQGVGKDTAVPETIGSTDRYAAYDTLPIACGIIKKADELPGTSDDGIIPGEIAPVNQQGDVPAPPDALDLGTPTAPVEGSNYSDVEDGTTTTTPPPPVTRPEVETIPVVTPPPVIPMVPRPGVTPVEPDDGDTDVEEEDDEEDDGEDPTDPPA
ncbi:MAG TPA: hypothetical protein VNJ01_07470 [Bacteriovoracaceae bacterium]|nr:hypothetical protein [Bacteriovoracaceae bacterium]